MPGLTLAGLVAVGAYGLGALVPSLSSLVWALILGAVVATAVTLPGGAHRGVDFAAKPVLKLGVVLLGFQISVSDAIALGPKVLLVVLVTLPVTFGAALFVGRRLGLSTKLSLLVGTGSAICGASAIAAMDSVADAEEEDVGFAVATVTLFGTVAVFAIPALAGGVIGIPSGVAAVWAGASVHEVGQVVAAASPLGNGALETATLVKLTRVALLAPSVLVVGLLMRAGGGGGGGGSGFPVPLFVLGFLGALAVRSAGVLPQTVIDGILSVDTALLTVALGGLGLNLSVRSMARLGWRPLALGLLVSVVVAAVSLAMILGLGV
ncbi:YeiH family protein [Rubrobacter aplysinae]|uniref:YeiH family protein n=1 Tax=Rubrobacter aplysinae TaxID=909625 RepID=UPI001364C342|nr:putative sulfate exporter family transporter [Rubrobacter aplysinae]